MKKFSKRFIALMTVAVFMVTSMVFPSDKILAEEESQTVSEVQDTNETQDKNEVQVTEPNQEESNTQVTNPVQEEGNKVQTTDETKSSEEMQEGNENQEETETKIPTENSDSTQDSNLSKNSVRTTREVLSENVTATEDEVISLSNVRLVILDENGEPYEDFEEQIDPNTEEKYPALVFEVNSKPSREDFKLNELKLALWDNEKDSVIPDDSEEYPNLYEEVEFTAGGGGAGGALVFKDGELLLGDDYTVTMGNYDSGTTIHARIDSSEIYENFSSDLSIVTAQSSDNNFELAILDTNGKPYENFDFYLNSNPSGKGIGKLWLALLGPDGSVIATEGGEYSELYELVEFSSGTKGMLVLDENNELLVDDDYTVTMGEYGTTTIFANLIGVDSIGYPIIRDRLDISLLNSQSDPDTEDENDSGNNNDNDNSDNGNDSNDNDDNDDDNDNNSNSSSPDNSANESQNTIPADNGSVEIEVDIEDGNITLVMPDEKIAEVIEGAENSSVVFDVSNAENVTEISIPKSAAAALSGENLGMSVVLPQGTVTLDSEALSSAAAQSRGADISVSIAQVAGSALNELQQNAVKENSIVYSAEISSNGNNITNFNGYLTITVNYDGPRPVSVWYLNDLGNIELVSSYYDSGTKTVKFSTNHLSNYMVGQDLTKPAPKVLAATKEAGTAVETAATDSTIILEGKATHISAVNIDGYNYLKLRDIAALLNPTSKKIRLSFNNGAVNILTGLPYAFTGDEFAELSGSPTAVATPSQLKVDGKPVDVSAYNIDGYTYFRLRDLAIILDFGVEFITGSGDITIHPDSIYSE